VTEHDWLTGGDSRPMFELVRTHARATPRVWRLFMHGFWLGQLPFILEKSARAEFLRRMNQLEKWADSGRGPRRRYLNVFMDRDAEEAMRRTVGVASQQGPSWKTAFQRQSDLLREIFGNPLRPVELDPDWLTTDVLLLAQGIYDEKAFDRMPILADALQDAGCASDDVLNHCRDSAQVHVRGCWVLDLLLEKR
jgi:hypothetical protein